jgi:hypothetical protein
MRLRRTCCAALLTVGLSAPAWAQRPSNTPHATPNPSTIDVSRLPLDLDRIERQLRQSSEREDHDGLRLRYFVGVYAQAPRIQLVTPEESLRTGPVPNSAPTHRDMLDVMTPKEFRSPPMDFNALVRWLSQKVAK